MAKRVPRNPNRELTYEAAIETVFSGRTPEVGEFFSYPETNRELLRTHDHLDERINGNVGMVASSIEVQPGLIRIIVPDGENLFRDTARVPAESLATRDDLKEQTLDVIEKGTTRIVNGKFAVQIATTMMLGNKVGVFEGMKGRPVTANMQQLPEEEMFDELMQNYFVVLNSKRSGKRRIVAPELGDATEIRHVNQAKERIKTSMWPQLSSAIKGANEKAVMDKLRHIDSAKELSVMKPADMGPDYNKAAPMIEVVVGDEVRRFRGYLDYDDATKTVTIARPIRFAVDTQDNTIEAYDASGKNRSISWVDAADLDKHGLLGKMFIGVEKRKKEKVIKKVFTTEPKEAQLLRSRYAVPPQITAKASPIKA